MSCTFTKEQEAKLKELENKINLDIEKRRKNGEELSLLDEVRTTIDHLEDSFFVEYIRKHRKVPENINRSIC